MQLRNKKLNRLIIAILLPQDKLYPMSKQVKFGLYFELTVN